MSIELDSDCMIGRRILVFWSEKARRENSEWVAFRVLDENDDGYWCEGVTNPCGSRHDGSKTFIAFDDTIEIMEWKEES